MVELKEGWNQIVQEGIKPLEEYLEKSTLSSSLLSKNNEGFASSSQSNRSVFTPKQFMQLYTLVYTMSTQRESNYSKQLYQRHGEVIEKYIQTKVLPNLEGKSGTDLLLELRYRWENHTVMNNWLERIFSYLDRYYIKANMEPTLKQKGLQIFLDQVITLYDTRTRTAFADLINQEREQTPVDRSILRVLSGMYVELGIDSLSYYHETLEETILVSTKNFYVKKTDEWITLLTFSEYIRQVEKVFQEESERCQNYLHELTWPKVLAVLQNVLLGEKMSQLLEMDTGIVYLFREKKFEDLKRTFNLFSLIEDGVAPLAKEFQKFIAARGTEVVESHSSIFANQISQNDQSKKALIQRQLADITVVEDLLALHEHFKYYTTTCFNQEFIFKRAVKDAFEEFMSHNIGSHPASAFLSAYCDQMLRSRMRIGQTLMDDQMEAVFERIVELFTFLTDKDLFAEIYRAQLARRLLTETSSSVDAEKLVIAKLKMRCGAQFTSRFEGMLNDLNLAHDTQRDFKRYLSQNASDQHSNHSLLRSQKFNAIILTTGYWPVYQMQEVQLPVEVSSCLDIFTKFYVDIKTSHRRLLWVHHLGHVLLLAQFSPDRMYTIQCNTYQACILLLFNNSDCLTFRFIVEALKLDPVFAKKLLTSLKVTRLLTKTKPETEEDNESFSLNLDFTSKLRLIKIPIPVQEELHNKDKIEEDRSVAIEAAIVRIMKAKKLLDHSSLVLEVINQLRFFKPNPRIIKTRIDSLIEREFLERCEDNAQYRYVA